MPEHLSSRGRPALSRREFLGAAALSAACFGCGAGAKDPLQPPNIVIFLSDTLRADCLSCYGNPVQTSPHLDALSREGVLFEQCFSHASWTKPSVASLFTGTVPLVHQAVISSWKMDALTAQRVQVLRAAFPTMAEVLGGAGYTSGFFLTNPHVQQEFGFSRGFNHYVYKGSQTPTRLVDDAIAWARQQPGAQPLFLMVHEIDPHGPYSPSPEAFAELHHVEFEESREALPEADRQLLRQFNGHFGMYGEANVPMPPLEQLTSAGLGFMRQCYEAEIFQVDREMGRLWQHFQEQATRETVFIFTSDHGEALGEHGRFGHGHTLRRELLHVPLVVHVGSKREAVRVPYTVGHVDLFATIAEIAGAAPSEHAVGRALFKRDGAVAVTEDQEVFSCLDRYKADVTTWDCCLTRGPLKAVASGAEPQPAVYDHVRDPLELENLMQRSPVAEAHQALAELLLTRRDEYSRRAAALGPPEWTAPEEEFQEELGALGYL